jgi:hypothetical protein
MIVMHDLCRQAVWQSTSGRKRAYAFRVDLLINESDVTCGIIPFTVVLLPWQLVPEQILLGIITCGEELLVDVGAFPSDGPWMVFVILRALVIHLAKQTLDPSSLHAHGSPE